MAGYKPATTDPPFPPLSSSRSPSLTRKDKDRSVVPDSGALTTRHGLGQAFAHDEGTRLVRWTKVEWCDLNEGCNRCPLYL